MSEMRFKKGDWVINKHLANPTARRITLVDTSGSARCYQCDNEWFMDSDLEAAEEKHFPKPNYDAPIKIGDVHSFSMYFRWGQQTVGFGEFSMSLNEGVVSADTEMMGPEWSRKAMYAVVDAMIEQGIKDGVWDGITKK